MVFKPRDATYVQITQQLPPFVVPLTQAPMGFFNDDSVCTHAENFEKIFLQCDPSTACEIHDKLEAYYQPEKNRLKMAMPADFGPEHVCVVMLRLPAFPNFFHRAIVRQRDVPSHGLNNVYLFDLGITTQVPTSAIFKPTPFCFDYPAQAVCCRLAESPAIPHSAFLDIVQYNENMSIRFDNRDGYFFEISIFVDDDDLVQYYEEQRRMVLPKLGVTYQRWKDAWMTNAPPPPQPLVDVLPPPGLRPTATAPVTGANVGRFDPAPQARQQGAMAPPVQPVQGYRPTLQSSSGQWLNEVSTSAQSGRKEPAGPLSASSDKKSGFGAIRDAVLPPPVFNKLPSTCGAPSADAADEVHDEETAEEEVATPGGYLMCSEKFLPALTQKAHPIVHKVCAALDKGNCRQLLNELGKRTHREVDYICLEDSGPCGNRIFVYVAKLGDRLFSEATDTSKKEAQEKAAQFAVQLLISENAFNWPGFDCSPFSQQMRKG